MSQAIGDERWRVFATRPRKPLVNITNYVSSVGWLDGPDVMQTGSILFEEPPYLRRGFPFGAGSRIIFQASEGEGQPFKKLWEMRCWEPEGSIHAGQRQFALADDWNLLARSEGDFRYVRNKRHSRGWFVHDVILDVCRRFAIPHASIPRMRHRIRHLVRLEASPADVIVAALRQERIATGRRFTVSMRSGRLVIRPLHRSNALMVLGPTLIEAALRETMKEEFGTTMLVRGTQADAKGKTAKGHKKVKHHKIAVRVKSKPAIARYGYVQRIVYAPSADTPAEARQLGLRHLARLMHPDREMSLQHEGIIGVNKGAALRIKIPEDDLNVLVWVSQASHTVDGNDYSMDLTLKFDDPFRKVPADLVTETLDQVAAKRNRISKQSPAKSKKQPRQRTTTVQPPPELGGVPTP